MALNPLQFPLYVLMVACCWLGRRVALRHGPSLCMGLLFCLLSLPALVYDLHYLRVWEEPMWLYRLRAWPGSELLAAPAGLFAGWVQGLLKGRWRVSFASTALLAAIVAAVPYVKQLSGPIELADKWRDGVCLQSSPSTCGPASAATLLTHMGMPTGEAELARDAFSTLSGTENWYLKRAIERRGASCRYVWVEPPVTQVPCPSIAGLKLAGGSGHFIAVLSESTDGWLIADPLYGRAKLTREALAKGQMPFSGFFLVLGEE